MSKNRMVLHIDMDAFFAAVEERDNPRFAGKPIVIGADPMKGKGRGVVSTANYEARKYGIKSAMPISWAYSRAPHAIYLPPDIEKYKKVSESIFSILKKHGKVEQISIDEAYINVEADRNHPAKEETPGVGVPPQAEHRVLRELAAKGLRIAKQIKKEIWEREKLTCSIGIGPNKLVAKIASDMQKPDGLTVVKEGEVLNFLAPLDVKRIPGIGPKTAVKLKKMNIRTVENLRSKEKQELIEVFGINGASMWEMSWGRDNREVETTRPIKSVGKQTTFLKDASNPEIITKNLFELVDQTYANLNKEDLRGTTITVIVRYSNFETHTRSKTSQNPITSTKQAKRTALQLLLPFLDKKRPIRLVGFRVSNF